MTATAWNALLARAEDALARRAFLEASRDAEALLRSPVPAPVRLRALVVAADAAYGLRAFGTAAVHYAEFVARSENGPAAAHAEMRLGWARLRHGDRAGARAAWVRFADGHAGDARSPLALALAAEVADQTGDSRAAQTLLDGLVAQYPASPYAAVARLSRSTLALRRGQQADAVRDLEAILAVGPAVLDERRKLRDALSTPGSEVALESSTPAPAGTSLDRAAALDLLAARLLDSARRERDPYVLHGVVLLMATDRGWSDVRTAALAGRLVEDFPGYPAGPPLLARVAEASATAGQWPVARQAWEVLLARSPGAAGRGARVGLGEALLRTGAIAPARGQLEQSAAAGGEEAARALKLLVELYTATGDPRAALPAYDRLLREDPRLQRSAPALLTYARLLEELGQSARARPVLEKAVELGRGEVAAEAAYRLGQTLSANGQHAAAVEWYLTAAYAAERSTWEHQALLGAGRSLAALNETKEALAAYWKLLPGRAGLDSVVDREISGEAAYRAGELLRGADLHADALAMFQTSAHLTAGSPAERRALLAALPCAAAIGDRQTVEAINQRLQQAAATEPRAGETRPPLRGGGAVGEGTTGGSALPAIAR
jgi:tetratricopeptide (TPR) repeat protein